MQNPLGAHLDVRIALRRLSLWFLVLVASCAIWASFEFDEPVRQAVVQTQGKGWKKSDDFRFKSGVRKFGDWPWLMLAGGLGLAISWRLKQREWMRILAAAMIASTLAGLLANTSRLTTGRTRPRESPKNPAGVLRTMEGRTLDHRRPAIQLVSLRPHCDRFRLCGGDSFCTTLAGHRRDGPRFALIAWSSVMMGAHHLSDVVVSTCLSLFVSWFTLRWAEKNLDAVARKG